MTESDGAIRPLPEDIFNDALDLPTEQRASYLAEACPDEEVRRLVEGMLRLCDADPSLRRPPEPQVIPPRLGKYELLEECGRGGMGIVFTARDTQLGRVVALKLLPAALAADPHGRERFLREARLLAALPDERIATIHTLEEAEGIHFLTMEHIEGRTLAQIMAGGPLPVTEALSIARQIALALAGAHAKQIVHRDLKPSNVMVTPDGRVKILDFGIAKVLGGEEASAAAAVGDTRGGADDAGPAGAPGPSLARGTPGYMAPEQLRGEPVDVRCDIWALGCVMYESLTGRYVADVADREGRFELAGLPSPLPRGVRSLIEACLEREPARRVTTAARAAEVLGVALQRLRARRRRRLALAALVAVPLLLVGAILWRTGPAPGPVVAIEAPGPQSVRAVDASGRQLWERTFQRRVATTGGLTPLVARAADGGVRGILVALGPEDGTTSVAWLAPEDGLVRWTWDADWQAPVNALGRLRIGLTRILPWPGADSLAIALTLYDAPWYSCAIQFLDQAGRPLGTYCHPGPLSHFEALPAGPDGEIRYLVAGFNSSARFVRPLVPFETRFHCGILAVLAPPELSGQAFPWSEGLPEKRDWPGMPRAREASYLVIPPLRPDFESSLGAVQVQPGPDGQITISVPLRDGRILFLDRELVPQSCYLGIRSLADSLHAAGRLEVPPLMLIRDGQTTWHDVPLTF